MERGAVLLRQAVRLGGYERASAGGPVAALAWPRLGIRSRLHQRPLRRWLRAAQRLALYLLVIAGLFQPLVCALHCLLQPTHRHVAAHQHAPSSSIAPADAGEAGCHALASAGAPAWGGGWQAPSYDALPIAALAIALCAGAHLILVLAGHGPPRRAPPDLLRPPKRDRRRLDRRRLESVSHGGSPWLAHIAHV